MSVKYSCAKCIMYFNMYLKYGVLCTKTTKTINNVHITHYTVHKVRNVHNVHSIHYTVHNVHITQYTMCTMYTVYIVHIIQCTQYTRCAHYNLLGLVTGGWTRADILSQVRVHEPAIKLHVGLQTAACPLFKRTGLVV